MYFLLHGAGQPLGDLREDLPGREADIPKYLRGNVKLVFASIFPGIETFNPRDSARLAELYGKWLPATGFRAPQSILLEHFSVYYKLVESYPELVIVESTSDIRRVFEEQGKIGLLLHLEGAEALDDPYDLVLLRKLGLRSTGITWNYNNKYGCGCLSKRDYGLTPEGEELVKTANKLGVIVDLAHASKRTALEAIDVSSKPVIISHANIKRIVENPRNVDDEVLEALYRNRGVLGVSVIGPLVSTKPKPLLEDLIEHFLYVYETYGVDILAIGTDFHGLLGLPAPEGLESVDRVQVLLDRLRERGLSESDIEKIAYRNAFRVISENLS